MITRISEYFSPLHQKKTTTDHIKGTQGTQARGWEVTRMGRLFGDKMIEDLFLNFATEIVMWHQTLLFFAYNE